MTTSERVLLALYEHRAATARQLHELLTSGLTLSWLRMLLRAHECAGLVVRAGVGKPPHAVWTLTPVGVRAVRGAGGVGYSRPAHPHVHSHALSLNEAMLTFVRAARQRHDPDPSWQHEIRLGPKVIADARLEYTLPDRLVTRLTELDRMTAGPHRLLQKLGHYAEQGRSLAPTLVVFDGGNAQSARRRLGTVAGAWRHMGAAQRAHILGVTLADLTEAGPFEAVFTNLSSDKRCNWLGEKRG